MEGQVADLEALMSALGRGNDGCVANQWVVDTRIRDKIRLELVQIHVQRAIESQTGRDRRDNLGDKGVQVLVVGTGDVEAALADVVDGFVVDEERAVGVLDSAVRGEDGIVRLDNGRGDARRWVYGKLELTLLAVIGREALKKKGTETGTSSTTERVENEETLEGRAVI